jgi:AcrR family transcriptional regulator
MSMTKSTSPKHAKRSYHSLARDRSAEETRQRILAASRELFASQGYAGTTLEAIAEKAQVSPKTVTAVFGTKRDILGAVVNPTAFPPEVQKLRAESLIETDPVRRVQLVAQIARQAYDALAGELELLRTAAGVAPELAELAVKISLRRRRNQSQLTIFLHEHKMLRRGLSLEEATDALWALASFDVYHLLVIERHWAGDRYEAWLRRTLIEQLLPEVETRSSGIRKERKEKLRK